MSEPLEIHVDGLVVRCYRTGAPGGEDLLDTYVVAGVGSISIARDTGEIVKVAAITSNGAAFLKKLAPMIHHRESGKYRL
jgi:hypothetical protein